MQKGRNIINNPVQFGLLLALAATLLYSLKPILIKLIYVHDISSVNILAWRVIISLPIYMAVGWWVWRQRRKRYIRNPARDYWVIKTIILGVLAYYLAALLDLIGLQYISSQLARLILFTYPTLVAVLGWLIFRQAIDQRVMVALVLSYLGVGFIFAYDLDSLGDQVIFGSVMMFLSALAFSLYVLLSKNVIDAVGGASFTVVAMLSSGVCILLHFLLTTQSFTGLAISMTAFTLIAVMAISTTVIPSFLIAEAIARIGPQRTAIAGTFGPAATSIFAVLILGEAFGWPQIAGIVLVVAAITYLQWDRIDERESTVEVDY
ncbi:MAG: DMT family transporter [Gammaproteobacteria bacterium]|nr:DMT family transporter [Gammaproteobacteria bacterium]